MSSSTSSFSGVLADTVTTAPSRTRRVLVVLAVLLVVLELVTRMKLFHMSKDFVLYESYPQRAAELSAHTGTRIAIVGNSITHEDIDPAALGRAVQKLTGPGAYATVFSADHSYVNTWYYMVERYFWRPGNHVDLMIVPFWGTNLDDGNDIELGRLAQFFTTVDDWPTLLFSDLRSNSDRADFLASTAWATFAARDRMRELVFTKALPDYKGYALREQDVLVNRLQIEAANRAKRPHTTHILQRLVERAREEGTMVVFMAFPTLHPEWSDTYADVARIAGDAGMRYVDLRAVPDVSEKSFVDLVHMNPEGRAVFTQHLAETLAPLLSCDRVACRAVPVAPAVAVAGTR